MAPNLAEIRKRVNRGVKFLDKNFPNWYRIIKIRQFDFANSCQCVVGQVFPPSTPGFEADTCEALKMGTPKTRAEHRHWQHDRNLWEDYGFDWRYFNEIEILQAEWLTRIREYRKGVR